MSVDQWYVPASLRTVGGGSIQFAFRWRSLRLMLYVAHEVTLEVNGVRASNVRLRYRDRTVKAEDLVKTD